MKHLETNWSRPVAKALITAADIERLMQCSMSHYDGVCQDASLPGPRGFLNAWMSKLPGKRPYSPDDVVEVEEEFRVFDTCCKILEQAPRIDETPAEATFRHDLRGRFSHLLHEMNNFVTTQRATCPGVVPRKRESAAHDLPPDDPEPDYKALYTLLIMAVSRKFEGEERFDTALRYILEAEGRPQALRLNRNDEGIWLHVDGGSKKAAIPLNFRHDGIVHAALSAVVERDINRAGACDAGPKQGN